MNRSERIEKERINLILDYPFYGYIAMQLDLIEDNSIPTACTNGKYIKYNSEFLKSLSTKQIKTLLVHELRHIIFGHHLRRGNRDNSYWNIAGDYVINYEIIYNDKLPMIEGMLIDSQYTEDSTEIVYSKIERNKDEPGKNNDSATESSGTSGNDSKSNDQNRSGGSGEKQEDNGTSNNEGSSEGDSSGRQTSDEKNKKSYGIGGVEDAPPDLNKAEEEEILKETIYRAVSYAEKAGKFPGHLKREITDILKPKVKWEQLLYNWFNEKSKDDFSWIERDNRILDYIFPSLTDESLGDIVLGIDTSGSINQNLLNQFISEIDGLRQKYKFNTLILGCSVNITFEKYFTKTQKLDVKLYGGGGTRFSPVFQRVKESRIRPIGLIYFTDLYCSDFGEKPPYDVLWLNYGYERNDVPFGKVINMEK